MPDEGFHEIQLNGKQLVFLFMAATVVSVVIFLCGVLVGRGVRTAQPDAALTTAATVAPDAGAARAPDAAPATPSADTPPPAPPDELSYYDRLQRQGTPPENLKPVERAQPPPPAARPPAVDATPAAVPAETAVESPGTGFAIQVAALRERREADSIVQRLIGKGYPAYVLAPAKGAPAAVYRVRVGKFKDRREAEEAAARLQKEEQFKPWIVR
jgi:cell division septation protein DedD